MSTREGASLDALESITA